MCYLLYYFCCWIIVTSLKHKFIYLKTSSLEISGLENHVDQTRAKWFFFGKIIFFGVLSILYKTHDDSILNTVLSPFEHNTRKE